MKNIQETAHVGDTGDKRRQILDAAYQVFSRKGYHRATVDEIIAVADTGKGTVYNYFVNKEQLFYTLIRERSNPFESALAEAAEAKEPPLVKIENMIRLFLTFYIANADLWRVLMHEMRGVGSEGYSSLTPEQREKYRQGFTHTIGLLEKVLAEGVEQGAIRQCEEKKAAYGLFSVIAMMVFQKFVGEDINESARSIADMFFYGVARQ